MVRIFALIGIPLCVLFGIAFQSLKGKLKGKQPCRNKEKACNHCGYRLSCWQREKDSNPHKQSQSLSCYPYTISLSADIIIHHLWDLSIENFDFFKKFFRGAKGPAGGLYDKF